MVTRNEIKLVQSLADKKGRVESGLFVAEGEKLITEIVKAKLEIKEMYRVNENCTWIEMNRMSMLKTPTRELALVKIPYHTTGGEDPAKGSTFALALDGVQDPGNLGSIIRTADWFGISTIYCSLDTADCFAPKVVQATMGAVARVRVVYCDLAQKLQQIGSPVLGTFLERSTNIYSFTKPSPSILVMGNEGRGISPDIERLVDHRLNIPRAGGGESLNVASATAIAVAILCPQL